MTLLARLHTPTVPYGTNVHFPSIVCIFHLKKEVVGGEWKTESKRAIHICEASVTADRPHRGEGETLACVQETQTYGMKQ